MQSNNDKQVLLKMKELIVEFTNLINMKFNEGTAVDIESLRESLSYLDIGIDMEILKLDEHNSD